MYRTVQFFVLALKIDIFIEFLVSVFYLIQFALKQGFHTWHLFLFIVITALMLPMLYFGRYAVRCYIDDGSSLWFNSSLYRLLVRTHTR